MSGRRTQTPAVLAAVIVSLLAFHPLAVACVLVGYSEDPPPVDHGYDEAESPAAPEVVEAYAYLGGFEDSGGGCPLGPQEETSCDGVEYQHLVIRLRNADEAVWFRLNWGEQAVRSVDHAVPGENEGNGILVVRAEYDGGPPLAFELTAFDADGYESLPVHVQVDRTIDERPQDGCAIGGGRGPARWVLLFVLLIAGRLLGRRRTR